jgi:hypothetical protein
VTYKYNDLSFGDVFIGYSENVPHTDSRAAKFYFSHRKFFRSDILVTFNLPPNLTNGIDNLPIIFNADHAAWSYRDRTTGRRTFNPNTPFEMRNIFFYFPVYIWLGGTINTHSGLTPGVYNGTITLTIEYL